MSAFARAARVPMNDVRRLATRINREDWLYRARTWRRTVEWRRTRALLRPVRGPGRRGRRRARPLRARRAARSSADPSNEGEPPPHAPGGAP